MTGAKTLERNRLYGTDSHVHLLSALEGLDAAIAGRTIEGFRHSIYQIVEHMAFWQEVALARIERRKDKSADCADDGWCSNTEPGTEAAWKRELVRLETGVHALEAHLGALDDDEVAQRNLRMVEGHNSYHLGQIVLLRTIFGAWPPPKGGNTW